MKYSKNFERDYTFYYNNRRIFTFCGTLIPKHVAVYDKNGKPAKEVFHAIESTGKNQPTSEPELLNQLLTCKASVNFHIKQWAEGRADGTLPYCEFAGDTQTLEWEVKAVRHKWFWWLPEIVKIWFGIQDKKIPNPIYRGSMKEVYGFPDWVIKAVEAQKNKRYQADNTIPEWFKLEAKRYENN